jgi:hypothetical protein
MFLILTQIDSKKPIPVNLTHFDCAVPDGDGSRVYSISSSSHLDVLETTLEIIALIKKAGEICISKDIKQLT